MDETYEVLKSMEIIGCAGDSKSNSTLAVRAARECDFEKAEELLKEAELRLNEAHQAQTDMLVYESNGNELKFSVLLVHAQDHLAMAHSAFDSAVDIVNLYQQVDELKKLIK